MAVGNYVNQRLSYESHSCTVRFIGPVQGTSGEWLGVEWDDPLRGKNDGSKDGVQYFRCLRTGSQQSNDGVRVTAGSFIRPTRPSDQKVGFVSALAKKYGYDMSGSNSDIEVGGKTVQEIGFERIQSHIGDFANLKRLILNHSRIAFDSDDLKQQSCLGELCPNARVLDLSGNLFEKASEILTIAKQLSHLETLVIDYNNVIVDLQACRDISLDSVTTLSLNSTFLNWNQDVVALLRCFPDLKNLSASFNGISSILSIESCYGLTLVDLSGNWIPSLKNISALAELRTLQSLSLKQCGLKCISDFDPAFSPSVTNLDISFNTLSEWSAIDSLSVLFPGLTSLRTTNNPLFTKSVYTLDECFLLTVARVGSKLQQLNFSTITSKETSDAETWYLSIVGRELTNRVSEAIASSSGDERLRNELVKEAERCILKQNPRYEKLVGVLGEPVSDQRAAIFSKGGLVQNREAHSDTLAARLVNVSFLLPPELERNEQYTLEVPRDYSIENIVGLLRSSLNLERRVLPRLSFMLSENTFDNDQRTLRKLIPMHRPLGSWVDDDCKKARVEVIFKR